MDKFKNEDGSIGDGYAKVSQAIFGTMSEAAGRGNVAQGCSHYNIPYI